MWANIKLLSHKTDRISFVSAFFIGLIVHFYVYTNLYLGHDASSLHNYNPSWDIVTGRYFGILVKELHGSLQVPFLIGLFTLVFLGFSSVLISKTLKVKDPVLLAFISAFIVSWPTITAMNCYLYMASQFTIAIFCACFAAYIAEKYRFGYLLGIPLLVVSMACYQAYWGTSAVLMLLCLTREVVSNKATVRELITKGLRFAITLGAGFLIYYVLWNVFFSRYGLTRTSYLGMDSIGYSSIAEFWQVLRNTYRTVFSFFFVSDKNSYYPVYVMIAGYGAIALSIALIGVLIKKSRIYRQPCKLLILATCILLLPPAMNCSEIFSKGVSSSALSHFAFMTPFLLLSMLVSILNEQEFSLHIHLQKKLTMCFALKATSVILLGISFLNGLYGANVTYLKIESNYHIAVSQATQWLSRIQAEDGYEINTPIAVVGQPKKLAREGFEWCDNMPGAYNTALTYDAPIRNFLTMLSPEINLLVDTTPYENLEFTQTLKPFPANDCVVWVDGVLVLKLS